jgi:hypothetical protein
MSDVVYDAGALIAAERNDRAFWDDHGVRLDWTRERFRSPQLPWSPRSAAHPGRPSFVA